jgi:hypothetical protein
MRMRREIASVIAFAALVAHGNLVLAQAASQPADRPVNPSPSTQPRFESTLKFDPRQRDNRPFTFVTPLRFDQMIRRTDIGGAQLQVPLPHGVAPGGVQLDVQPWRAEVYVDGEYAGLVDDFKGYYRHLEVSAGPHVIVIVAPHYDPLIVNTLVSPGQVTTYRGTLSLAARH